MKKCPKCQLVRSDLDFLNPNSISKWEWCRSCEALYYCSPNPILNDITFKEVKSEKEKNIYTVRTKLPGLQTTLFNKGKKRKEDY